MRPRFSLLRVQQVALLICLSGCQIPESGAPRDRLSAHPCAPSESLDLSAGPTEGDSWQPTLARNFSVEYGPGWKQVTVLLPQAGALAVESPPIEFSYLLLRCGATPPEVENGVSVLKIPSQRIATASTTVLSHFDELGTTDRLVGHQGLRNVTSATVRARAEQGLIDELGDGATLDRERLLSLGPDLFLSYLSGGTAVQDLGVPTVYMSDFLEATPLARAEWLFFTSLFFDREQQALESLAEIRASYEKLVSLAATAKDRPKILFSAPFSGVWHVPGGQSFAGQLIADAGGDYLWADLNNTGSVPMDIEAVWERAHQADLWLQPFGWTSLEGGIAIDSRFADLPTLQRGDVFNNDLRTTPEGGNDYWELGALRPDLVLADLVHILHPELLPDHELVFHRRLPRR